MKIKSSSSRSLFLFATIVSFYAIFSKILGLIREMLIANYFGATKFTDAYLIGWTVPETFLHLIAGRALVTAFIPVFTDELEKKNYLSAWRMANALRNLVNLIFVFIVLFIYIFSYPIIRTIAPGIKDSVTINYAVTFMRILSISLIFTSSLSIYTGILNTFKKFYITGLSELLLNAGIVFSLIFFVRRLNIYSIVLGAYEGRLLFLLLLIIGTYKINKLHNVIISFRDKLKIFHPQIKNIAKLYTPLLFGNLIGYLNIIVDRTICSFLPPGNIASLSFAGRIVMIAVNIISIPVSTVLYPELSLNSARNNIKKFSEISIKSMKSLLYLMVPLTVFLFVYREEIVTLLFKRGNFDERAVILTANVLIFYSFYTIFISLNYLSGTILNSLKLTKITTLVNSIGILVNIFLSLVLVKTYKLKGIAFATSFSAFLIFILYLFFISKHIRIGNFIKYFSKIIFIGAILFLGLFFFARINFLTGWKENILKLGLKLFISGLVLCFIYFILSFFIKAREYKILFHLLKKK